MIQIAYHGMILHTKTASECKLNIIRLYKPEFSLLAKYIWVHNIKARGWITRLKCSLDINFIDLLTIVSAVLMLKLRLVSSTLRHLSLRFAQCNQAPRELVELWDMRKRCHRQLI